MRDYTLLRIGPLDRGMLARIRVRAASEERARELAKGHAELFEDQTSALWLDKEQVLCREDSRIMERVLEVETT